MKLISMRICPYVQQVRVLLEAKGVSYGVEHIQGGEARPQWLLDASPDGGEVPVIFTDGGEALFQSDAILEYIDEVEGEPLLAGSALERARDKALSRLASDNYLVQCSTQRSPDEATLNERLEDLTPIFLHMEGQLGAGPYFRGRTFGMVDVGWLPLLHRTALVAEHAGYDFLEPYPKLREWRQALLDTGLGRASVPRDFDGVFTEFYLDPETHLGRLAEAKKRAVA